MKKSPVINYLRALRVHPTFLGPYVITKQGQYLRDPEGWAPGSRVRSRSGATYRVADDGSLLRA